LLNLKVFSGFHRHSWLYSHFWFWIYMEGNLRCPNFKISSTWNFYTTYPNLSKCLQFCSTMKFTWLNSNLNLRLSNLYARNLPLAIWILNYKIWVHRTNFLTPKHLTTVPSDLFYDKIWSRFNLSLSKIVGRYLKDFSFLSSYDFLIK
jgi:hypothetical protein